MKQLLSSPLFLLLLGLLLHAMGWVFKSQFWDGATALRYGGAALAAASLVMLVLRKATQPSKRPMD